MKRRRDVLTGEHFINGDSACAEGAIAAGCRFFAGYPITPATEVAETMARRLPEVDGIFIQMEDEIASMNCILGASWSGVKSMSATSGPGFSLMMENFGLGIMTETPCVLVNVMRGGPSTGLPTLVGQADIMQARWGSHGDYEVIAYTPNSPQEMFDLTINAFNMSEIYRLPVLVMADEIVGHMTEKVVIPTKGDIKLESRKKPKVPPESFIPYLAEDDLVPPMACAGEGYHAHVTGLTHDEKGYPVITPEAQERLVRRLCDKIKVNADKIIETEELMMDDAEVVVVSYGITSRVAMRAVQMAREEGIRTGYFRLITVWPFPENKIRKLAGTVKGFVVPEINCGQIVKEVERCTSGKADLVSVPNMGGTTHKPEEILDAIRGCI